jgi:hypothetical protein
MCNARKVPVVNLSGSFIESNYYSQAVNTLLYTSASATTASLYSLLNATNSYGGVIFGTGTTPATEDDYNLSGELITTLSGSASVTVTADDNNGVVITAVYPLTNTGSAAVTIGEMGIICSSHNSGNNGASYKVMYERTVLDEPITIPAGGVGTVTYTLNLKLPGA